MIGAGNDADGSGADQTQVENEETGKALDSMLEDLSHPDRELVHVDTETDGTGDAEEDGGDANKDGAGKESGTTGGDAGSQMPQLTSRLKNVAAEYGIDDDAIMAMGDTAEAALKKLADANTELSRRQTAVGKRLAELDAEDDGGGVDEQGTSGDGASGSDDESDDDDGDDKDADDGETDDATDDDATAFGDLDIYSDPQDIAKAVAARADSRVAELQEQVVELEGMVTGLVQEMKDRRAKTELAHFWLGLDPSDHEQYGVGPTEDLPEGGPEQSERAAVLAKAKLLRRGHAFAEQKELEWSIALHEAKLILGRASQQATTRQGNENGSAGRQDRSDQAIGRPGSRQTQQGQTRQEAAGSELDQTLARLNATG